MSMTTIVVIALIILAAIVLIPFTNLWAKTVSGNNKIIISQWVSTTNTKLSITAGYVQETGEPPVRILYKNPIEIYEEKDFLNNGNKIIADTMLDCLEAFHYGEMPFLGSDFSGGDAFCFPCAQIRFSQKIKNKYKSLEDIKFSEFLNHEKPYFKEGKTYNELFMGKLIYDPVIDRDTDFYIFFVASKGDIVDRIYKAYGTGTSFVFKSSAIFTVFKPTLSYFFPTLILSQPEKIMEICNT